LEIGGLSDGQNRAKIMFDNEESQTAQKAIVQFKEH